MSWRSRARPRSCIPGSFCREHALLRRRWRRNGSEPFSTDHPGGLVVFIVMSAVRVVPQARRYNVERFGRYRTTLQPGLNFIIPVADRINTKLDVREQVFSSQPKPVITEDNLVVNIDTVLYYQITDPRAAAYEIADYLQAIDQLTVTTLRNVIGSMDLEQTLTSREEINTRLRIVLDEATGKWGIRVNRVEIKAIDPPITIKEAMEKQMRAERDKRAAILHAEGERQCQDPHRRRDSPAGDPGRAGRPAGRDPPRRRRGQGRRPGLPGRPPQQRRSEGAGLQVPGDAAAPGQEAATPSGSSPVSSPKRFAPSPRPSATTPGRVHPRPTRAGPAARRRRSKIRRAAAN